jgi:hypothetical protein
LSYGPALNLISDYGFRHKVKTSQKKKEEEIKINCSKGLWAGGLA